MDHFPALSFETQDDPCKLQPIKNSVQSPVYLVRNILWNCSDDDAVKILRTFVPELEKSLDAILLVNEMMSPATGTFDRHVEKGYRRRDVTVMTMHNAKQRTEEDWRALFTEASPNLSVSKTGFLPPSFKYTLLNAMQFSVRTASSSHSYRGLWELRSHLAN